MATARELSLSLHAGDSGSMNLYANKVLCDYDAYIYSLAQRTIPTHFGRMSDSHAIEMEIDEIAQRSRIKFWLALKKRDIPFPKTYIRCIVKSECIDLARQHRPTMPLPVDDDGELSPGVVLLAASEKTGDPQMIVEQEERLLERLRELVDIVRQRLSRRQRQAFLRGLFEKLDDDDDMLKKTLQELEYQHVNLDEVFVPTDSSEKRTLQASNSQARRTIARYMNMVSSA